MILRPLGLRRLLPSVALGDPFWSDVFLLMSAEGADGSTTLTDLSAAGLTLTANADAQIDTSDPDFSSGGLLLDGSGDDVSVSGTANSFVFTASDSYCIEWYGKHLSFPTPSGTYENGILGRYGSNTGDLFWYINGPTAPTPGFAIRKDDGLVAECASTISVNELYHGSYQYDGNTGIGRFRKNGVQQGADITTMNVSCGTSGGAQYIGSAGPALSSFFKSNMLLNWMRGTKALRYPTDFTPPSRPYPIGAG